MRNKLKSIIYDMGFKAFTIDEKADYLLQHDVVPVVRCKDCKYGFYYNDVYNEVICDEVMDGRFISGDAYCSCGERKEDR